MDIPCILSLTTFFPLVGVLLIMLIKNDELAKKIAFFSSLLVFVFSLHLYFHFDAINPGFQFTEDLPWIGSTISYSIGVDGISLFLILITTFLMPITLLGAWNSIQNNVRGFLISLLMLEIGMVGVFSARDAFLFYVFWEAMLIPMYFLIGIWGGKERIYAAVKFFIYTMFGSLLMLVALIYIYKSSPTANIADMLNVSLTRAEQIGLFAAFALAFAIKVPLFPFHTWLPDAHVQAPTAGSVILAGVLLKMGGYGFLRFCLPLFPEAVKYFAPFICTLAVIGIIYGALVSMVQPDIKKLVAYSSVSHLGFVMLGLFSLDPVAVKGGILQMVNHGLSTGALFLLVGMIYDRRHTRLIADFGGITKVVPVFAFFFMIVTFSSIGLPGTNGFVGEFMILLGSFKSTFLGYKGFAIAAASGVIFAAVYMLWMFQRVMFGPLENPDNKSLVDLNKREIALLIPLILFIIGIGVYPKPFLDKMDASVQQVIDLGTGGNTLQAAK